MYTPVKWGAIVLFQTKILKKIHYFPLNSQKKKVTQKLSKTLPHYNSSPLFLHPKNKSLQKLCEPTKQPTICGIDVITSLWLQTFTTFYRKAPNMRLTLNSTVCLCRDVIRVTCFSTFQWKFLQALLSLWAIIKNP